MAESMGPETWAHVVDDLIVDSLNAVFENMAITATDRVARIYGSNFDIQDVEDYIDGTKKRLLDTLGHDIIVLEDEP